MKPKTKRLLSVALITFLLGGALFLTLLAAEDSMMYFMSPKEILEQREIPPKTIRLGGLVKQGSLRKLADPMSILFTVTDLEKDLDVEYKGPLPDLFREGQGIIAIGHYKENRFHAKQILAKHDENYMPREIVASLAKKE